MEILDLKSNAPLSSLPSCVLCLGNFDGVHTGHAALLHEALRQKALLSDIYDGIICGVCTFREPTQEFLRSVPTPRITSLCEKEELFRAAGMDCLITVDFQNVRNMTPAEFVSEILTDACHCVMAVCGYNYRFGVGGTGDPETLTGLLGGRASVVAPVMYNGNAVSSTAIRTAVQSGDMKTASAMLGRCFSINAEVTHGRAVGSSLGFATLNQRFREGCLIPAYGVYISRCEIDGKVLPAVSNVGVRPTFGNSGEVVCESHIFDYCDNAYGKIVRTELIEFLRPEQNFNTPIQLVKAIQKDIETAKSYFGGN